MGKIIALDVGSKRIGVAEGDESLRIAYPIATISVNGLEMKELATIVSDIEPAQIVIGFPRNQAGEPTAQTALVETFAEQLKVFKVPIIFQDESLTSVVAEERLRRQGKPYTKEAIDAEAATLILQDYLDQHGH